MATPGPERKFTPRKLELPDGPPLPPSVPFIIRGNYTYNQELNELQGSPDNTQELQIVPLAIKLLNLLGRKPVGILSICGPYRSGKSFFLSHLIGAQDSFKVGHSVQPCTRGIWMSTTVLECDEFILLLLDTEGIGSLDSGMADDMNILTLTLLLSSYMIYNSKNLATRDDLEKMM